MKQNLVETFAALERSLAYDFRILPQEVPDAPLFLAIALPLSPEVTGLRPRLPSGRGTSLAQALVSAGAEALELRAGLSQNHAKAIAALPRQDGRAMVAAQDMLSGTFSWVPADQVFLDLADGADGATSNGLATGATLADARRMALLECLERDATALWWHGGLPARALPLDLIDDQQPRLLWWLQQRPRQTRLLGLQSETGVPVVAALSADPDGHRVALGAAAREDVTAAALAAVTEMIQTEQALAAALAAGDAEAMEWNAAASLHRQPQFQATLDAPPPPAPPGTEALSHRMADLGLRALTVEVTLHDDPLPTARVLVPGLSAMGGRLVRPRLDRLCPDAAPSFPEPF